MSDHPQDEAQGSGAPQDDAARRYPPPPGAAPKKKPRWGFIILGVVVVIGAVLAILYWFAHRNEVTTDDAFTDGRAVTIAPRVSGNVVRLAVDDNQYVHAGQLLVRIDPRDFIASRDKAQGNLVSMQAQLANAVSNLAIIQRTQPAKLAQAQAQVTSALASQTRAEADYRRFHSIDPAATTRQDIDQATATNRQAAAQVAQAQAQVAQADTVALDVQQAQAQITQLRGQVAQAQAQLYQANIDLGDTDVVAPQDGWITRRNVETGNYAQPGATIFSLVTPDIWITANFKENQLARMRTGQKVDIAVDAYPQLKLKGHLDSVQLGSGSKFSAFPAENATGNFVKIVQRVPVKIVIDSGLDPNVPLPLGVSVEPTVYVK